jgi:hypothetical protein
VLMTILDRIETGCYPLTASLTINETQNKITKDQCTIKSITLPKKIKKKQAMYDNTIKRCHLEYSKDLNAIIRSPTLKLEGDRRIWE